MYIVAFYSSSGNAIWIPRPFLRDFTPVITPLPPGSVTVTLYPNAKGVLVLWK